MSTLKTWRDVEMKIDRDLTFDSVVFGTDLSESAQAAGRYAALFARHFDADFIVAHAFTLEQPALEVEALRHGRSLQRMNLEHVLSETLKDLGPLASSATSLLGEGSPIDLIRTTSERHGHSLVVLGTHGRGMLERHMIGSVAEELLRTIHSPVLTVGPHVAVPASTVLTFRHILYATDFSPASAHAAPYAMALARAFGSAIDLLHVVPEEVGRPDHVRKHEQTFLSTLLRLIPTQAAELGRSRTFVQSGNVGERIIEHVRENGVDLIVLGAHHHSWLARRIRTDPVFQIILAAACPVLTICRTQAAGQPSRMPAPP